MTTCVLLFLGGFSSGATNAQEMSPDTKVPGDDGHESLDEDVASGETTPAPPLAPRPIEVGPWRIASAEVTGTGRVEARAMDEAWRWVISSRSWQTRGEQLLFEGDARLVGEGWVLQASQIVLERSKRGWFAVASLDATSARNQDGTTTSLVLFFKEGIPIEAAKVHIELESGKISLEGIARADRRDEMERKRESVREE